MLKMITGTLAALLVCTLLAGCGGGGGGGAGVSGKNGTRPPPPQAPAPGSNANDEKAMSGGPAGSGPRGGTTTSGK
jgi:hypothetical protein